MSVRAYFDHLGAALEAAWDRVDRDEEAFPDVAREALEAHPPRDAFDRDAFVAEQLDPSQPARRQLAPPGVFGQPSFTVFSGHGFLIDVYFWVSSLSAIHNHPFCGTFTVLDGFSAHAVYAFDERERVGPRLRIGALRQTGLELVEAGEVHRFSLRAHPLVHSLIHIPRGAVSMVCRTARTVGYERYFPPSLAVALEADDALVVRRVELIETLRQSRDPRFGEHLERFLATAGLEATFTVLTRLWGDCSDADRAHLIERVRARHGARADRLPPAMERATRWFGADALREQLVDADDRLVATTLMLAEDRASALRLIGARHDDPVARLHRFVDEVVAFAPDDPAAPVLAHALVDGLDVEASERRLVETFGEANLEPGQRDVIARVQRASILAALGG